MTAPSRFHSPGIIPQDPQSEERRLAALLPWCPEPDWRIFAGSSQGEGRKIDGHVEFFPEYRPDAAVVKSLGIIWNSA